MSMLPEEKDETVNLLLERELQVTKAELKRTKEYYKLESLVNLQKEVHKLARIKGWYDPPKNFVEEICLVHSELSEAIEEYRSGRDYTEVYYTDKGKPEGIPIELADAVIRILDMAEHYNINLCDAINEKHEFNATRPHRHGGKKV